MGLISTKISKKAKKPDVFAEENAGKSVVGLSGPN